MYSSLLKYSAVSRENFQSHISHPSWCKYLSLSEMVLCKISAAEAMLQGAVCWTASSSVLAFSECVWGCEFHPQYSKTDRAIWRFNDLPHRKLFEIYLISIINTYMLITIVIKWCCHLALHQSINPPLCLIKVWNFILGILNLGREIAQSVQCFQGRHKDLCMMTRAHVKKLGTVAYTCNPSTQEAEEEGLKTWGLVGLHTRTKSKEIKYKTT